MAAINTSTGSMMMQPKHQRAAILTPNHSHPPCRGCSHTRLDSVAEWRMCTSSVSQRDKPEWRIAQVQEAAAGIDPAHCAVRINILIINYGFQQPKALHIFPGAFVCLLHCLAHCTPLVALICKHGCCMSMEITFAETFSKIQFMEQQQCSCYWFCACEIGK